MAGGDTGHGVCHGWWGHQPLIGIEKKCNT